MTSVEGGRWHDPGIEAWLDCIWRGKTDLHTYEAAREANLAAAKCSIREMDTERPESAGVPDVFILSAKGY